MRSLKTPSRVRGLTLTEVLVVSATIGVLAAVALPAVAPRRSQSARISCICHLKQIGIAFRLWANDHAGNFPWTVAQTNGGTLEFAMSSQVWRHFQVASNELNSPKILTCPADSDRTRLNSFALP